MVVVVLCYHMFLFLNYIIYDGLVCLLSWGIWDVEGWMIGANTCCVCQLGGETVVGEWLAGIGIGEETLNIHSFS